MRILRIIAAAVASAALSLNAASGAQATTAAEGGTFRMAVSTGVVQSIDPALYGLESLLLRPACAALMSYPDKPLPEGLVLMPELATEYPVVSKDRRTYVFTIRKDARFSDGAPVMAGDFVHALERTLDPKMKTGGGSFADLLGARAMLAGTSTRLAGAVATGRTLRLTLTEPAGDFLARLSGLCAVPSSLPTDPEGAKAPLQSPAPYYVSEYQPGVKVVLERNRFYRGDRPHHVARIELDLQGDASSVDKVASGTLDSVAGTPDLNPQVPALVRRYGVNRSRFFLASDTGTRMFLMNTHRPLFKNNVPLRRALNFAVDRTALLREYGRYLGTTTDHYLPRIIPGFRKERIYPREGPDLRRARALAKGHLRSRKAVLYTCSDRQDCINMAQVLQQNLRAIGLKLEIKQYPIRGGLLFQKLDTPGEPYDLAWVGYVAGLNDPQALLSAFDGRTIGTPDGENWSYFNSPKYNRLFEQAASLSGTRRFQTYGDLDVALARDAAPAIAVLNPNAWAFVSARVGCVVMNPSLDLTAVCVR